MKRSCEHAASYLSAFPALLLSIVKIRPGLNVLACDKHWCSSGSRVVAVAVYLDGRQTEPSGACSHLSGRAQGRKEL